MLSRKAFPTRRSKYLMLSRVVVFLISLFVFAAMPAAADQSPPNSFAGQVMANGKTGRVGIGTTAPEATLDVYHGEIKLGSTGAASTKELAGSLRSDKTRLQFCDGAGWRNVSLDKAQ